MEALRLQPFSPHGHSPVGSSTAAPPPTGFDAHFLSTFNYFGNEFKQLAHHSGAAGISSTRQRRQPLLHSDNEREDFIADLLTYVNDHNEYSSSSERTKPEVEDSYSIEDGPSDFTENLAEGLAGGKALSALGRSDPEGSASPKTGVTVSPKASRSPPSPTVEVGTEVDSSARSSPSSFMTDKKPKRA